MQKTDWMVNLVKKIKFRAWDNENKVMVYPKGILFDGRVVNFSCGVLEPYEGYELMQFTGLYDKNGKEIYAGDIVRGKYGKNGIVKNYEIRWLIGHFAAVDRNNITGDEHYYPIGLLEGEVIGNIFQDGDLLHDSQSPDKNKIYENLELLEGEKHD